jgi:hypothetical protein
MENFSLLERYSLIQIPFRGFLHNLDYGAQLSCLKACHAHLRPGGRLVLDVFYPSLERMALWQRPNDGIYRMRSEISAPEGCRLLISEMSEYVPRRQQLVSYLRYETFAPNGALVRTHMQRLELAYLYPGDMRGLLASAGFSRIEIEGDFSGKPVGSGDEMIVSATVDQT